ncbi:MAG: hypothetical protein ACYTE3_22240 [Planctomycetota bacterium]|jgi:hypothetical protein
MIVLATLAETGSYMPPESAYWQIFVNWIVPPLIPVTILLTVCLWRAAKYFGSAATEQKLLRIETGKLAEEVHLLREDIEVRSDNRSG